MAMEYHVWKVASSEREAAEQCFSRVVLSELCIRSSANTPERRQGGRGREKGRNTSHVMHVESSEPSERWSVLGGERGDQRGVWVIGLARSDWLESRESLMSYYLQRRPARLEPSCTHPSPAPQRKAEMKTA